MLEKKIDLKKIKEGIGYVMQETGKIAKESIHQYFHPLQTLKEIHRDYLNHN